MRRRRIHKDDTVECSNRRQVYDNGLFPNLDGSLLSALAMFLTSVRGAKADTGYYFSGTQWTSSLGLKPDLSPLR